MTLPVTEIGQLLLGTKGAEITGLTFVHGIGGVIRIEMNQIRHTT